MSDDQNAVPGNQNSDGNVRTVSRSPDGTLISSNVATGNVRVGQQVGFNLAPGEALASAFTHAAGQASRLRDADVTLVNTNVASGNARVGQQTDINRDNVRFDSTATQTGAANRRNRTTQPRDQPLTTGFSQATGVPAPRAEMSSPPAWPTNDPPGDALPMSPAPSQSPPPPSSQNVEQLAVSRFRPALGVLYKAMVGQALDAMPNADDHAQQELGRGGRQTMAIALYALAAEGRARAQADDVAAEPLRDAGIEQCARHLEAVADQMAARAGFRIPAPLVNGTPTPGHALVAAAQSWARTALDALTADPQRLRVLSAGFLRPTAHTARTGSFPGLHPLALRSPAALRQAVDAAIDVWRLASQNSSRQGPQPGAGAGLLAAYAIVSDAVRDVGVTSVPAQVIASRNLQTDPTPLHTAMRLGQFAATLDGRMPSAATQLATLGTYDQRRTLADHLRAVAAEIQQVAHNPVSLAQARVAGLFEAAVPAINSTAPASAAAAAQPMRRRATVAEAVTGEHTEPMALVYEYGHLERDVRMASTPETALLGSLIHAPNALDDMSFLRERDFDNPQHRLTYRTLRELWATGQLLDVAAMPNHDHQMQAAEENRRKMYTALRSGAYGDAMSTSTVRELLSSMDTAAPASAAPWRGVYAPVAQLQMARMVKEDCIRRDVTKMGVSLRKPEPAIGSRGTASSRGAHRAHTLVDKLRLIEQRVDGLATEMKQAVLRTGIDRAEFTPDRAESAIGAATPTRRRFADQLKAIVAEPLLLRAEQHLIHLALHSGYTSALPESMLDLPADAFSNEIHANTWRAIQEVRERGWAVNHTSVQRIIRAEGFAHHPVLPERALVAMAAPPEQTPKRFTTAKVARSLRTVLVASLDRAQRAAQDVLVTVAAAGPAVPAETVLAKAKAEISNLTGRATTAAQLHRDVTGHYQARRGSAVL